MIEFGYFVKEHGETIDDAEARCVREIGDAEELDDEWHLEAMAEEAAEYAWSENDGWEWLRDGTVLTLVADGKELGDFAISVDMEPTFMARKPRKATVNASKGGAG